MKWQIYYRLFNALIAFGMPLVISCFLNLLSFDPNNFLRWFLEAAFWLFCGPIPLVVDLFRVIFGWHENYFTPSVILRLLSIAPFLLYVPKQYEVARKYLVWNVVITIVFVALGFLWLVLSGI